MFLTNTICAFFFLQMNLLLFSQPMIAFAYSVDDFADDLLPANNEDVNQFSSMEIPTAKTRNIKREARPLINLIMDILDTFYTSTKADARRAQLRDARYTR